MSVNKVILIGNLGNDPDVRRFDNGGMITNISVATSERWNDRNTGERKEHTEWHRVVLNNRLAEIAAQYLRKGSKVYIEGSLRTRKWTDQQTGQERYATEIRADSLQMLDSRNDGNGGYQGNQNQYNGGYNGGNGFGGNQNFNNQNQYNGGGYNNNGGNQGYNNRNQFNNAPQNAPAPQNQGFGGNGYQGGQMQGFDAPQNNSFAMPQTAPAAPTTPPPAATPPASTPVITPADNSSINDDDIPF